MPPVLSQTIVYTLFHSLWQGAVLAVLAGGLLILTRRLQSSKRYNGLLLLLTLFALTITFTFIHAYNTPSQATPTSDTAPLPAFYQSLAGFLSGHSMLIASIWAITLLLRITLIGWDLLRLSRIKATTLSPVFGQWATRVSRLQTQLDISRPVRLFESSATPGPMTIGCLKPIILLPRHLANQLPANEMESVLLHELAHIRRNDFVINLAIQAIQAILFFNPAVWWLTHLIRTERENSCDDLAINHLKNKTTYVRTLIRFAGPRSHLSRISPAFPGTKNATLARIERIAAGRNRSLSRPEWIMWTALIVAAIGLIQSEPSIPFIRLTPPSIATVSTSTPAETESLEMAAKKKAEATAMKQRH